MVLQELHINRKQGEVVCWWEVDSTTILENVSWCVTLLCLGEGEGNRNYCEVINLFSGAFLYCIKYGLKEHYFASSQG